MIAVLCGFFFGACALASPPSLRWHGYSFHEVDSLSSLPAPLRQMLGTDVPGKGGIADKGQPFNITDVASGTLPMRRFLAAGNDGDVWLVALEQGGIAYMIQVYLFTGNVQEEHCVLSGGPKTLEAVIRLLPATCPKDRGS
ncbi:MAG: hypothetical protein FWC42_09065 [Proteobacteria bacterium]|nr:hypothetical protein [Pseudomonadota bacterium]MCL2310401.1 hypothetical protein [Pseudomonadota bacterium]